jgi:hypothetical protein
VEQERIAAMRREIFNWQLERAEVLRMLVASALAELEAVERQAATRQQVEADAKPTE